MIGVRNECCTFTKRSKRPGCQRTFCQALSLALQYGLPLDAAIQKFRDMRFEPLGATTNEQIPVASSLIDYIVRYLDQHWGDNDETST